MAMTGTMGMEGVSCKEIVGRQHSRMMNRFQLAQGKCSAGMPIEPIGTLQPRSGISDFIVISCLT